MGLVRGQKGKDKMSEIKMMGLEIGEDGYTEWRNNGGVIERRFLYARDSARWESVALTPDCPRTAKELKACCKAGGFGYRAPARARG